jgi:hypothetical protein
MCGATGYRFHRLGCRLLTTSLAVSAVIIGAGVTLLVLAWWVGGGGRPRVELGYALTAAFIVAALLSRSRRHAGDGA